MYANLLLTQCNLINDNQKVQTASVRTHGCKVPTWDRGSRFPINRVVTMTRTYEDSMLARCPPTNLLKTSR